MLLHCSIPDENSSLSWYAKYSIPVIKKKFTTREIMFTNDSIVSTFKEDSLLVGDTFHISFVDTFIDTHYTLLYFQENTSFTTTLDELQTRQIPPVTCTLAVPDSGYPTTPLPVSLPVTLDTNTFIDYFEYIKIHPSSDSIKLFIRNTSAGAILKDISLTIFCNGIMLISLDTIPLLAPRDSIIRKISLAGKTIRNNLHYTVHAEISKGSIVDDNTGLQVTFDCNMQKIVKAVINDIYCDYTFGGTCMVPITFDTFDLAYVDILKSSIPIKILNSFPFDIEILPEIHSVFTIDYCKKENINSYADLEVTSIDSSQYLGNTISPLVIKGTDDIQNPVESRLNMSLSNGRFFPQWDPDYCISYISVHVNCHIKPRCKTIIIENTMPISLSITKPEICFTEIAGAYRTNKFYPGNLTTFPVPLPNASVIFNFLRNRFKLTRTNVDFSLQFLITDNTNIAAMDYKCIFPHLNDTTCYGDTLDLKVQSIKKDTSYSFSAPLDSLVNTFPDSLGYVLNTTFPKNKEMIFGKDALINKPNYSYIQVFTKYGLQVNFYLVWQISDTIHIDLQDLHTPLDFNQTVIQTLQNMSLNVQCMLFNQTNLFGRLFGLAATEQHSRQLMDLMPEEISPEILSTEKASFFIPVLGDSGLILPRRNTSIMNNISLSDVKMNELVNSDSLIVRWGLLLPPTNADALTDTDYVFIDASFALEGIQSTNISNSSP